MAATRPRREVPKELPPLSLAMLPPHTTMVLTPRTDDHGKKIAPTWCKVIGHRGGMLLVMPEGDTDPSTVSLIWLNELRKDVHAVFKRVPARRRTRPRPRLRQREPRWT